MKVKDIINDIDIIKESIHNGDTKDALQMLSDIQEDLRIIELTS